MTLLFLHWLILPEVHLDDEKGRPSLSWSFWKFELQLPVQSEPITTKFVSSNPAHSEV